MRRFLSKLKKSSISRFLTLECIILTYWLFYGWKSVGLMFNLMVLCVCVLNVRPLLLYSLCRFSHRVSMFVLLSVSVLLLGPTIYHYLCASSLPTRRNEKDGYERETWDECMKCLFPVHLCDKRCERYANTNMRETKLTRTLIKRRRKRQKQKPLISRLSRTIRQDK